MATEQQIKSKIDNKATFMLFVHTGTQEELNCLNLVQEQEEYPVLTLNTDAIKEPKSSLLYFVYLPRLILYVQGTTQEELTGISTIYQYLNRNK